MKAHVALKLVSTVALLVPFGCSGNGCSRGKVLVNEPGITFVFPTDGSQVVPTDDVNTSAPGIQINVSAKVENVKAGESLYLWNDVDGVTRRIEGTVQGAQIVFPGYTLPVGRVTLRIAVPAWDESMGCEGQRCGQVGITVIAAACTYNDPHDGDILTTDQYPVTSDPLDPFERDVTLGCMGMDASDSRNHVELRVSGGRVLTALPDAAGNVTFTQVALAEGSNTLAAIPYVVTTTGAGDPPTPGAIANATVTVNTGRCLAALEPIDGARVLAEDDDDLDPSNGMQATLALITDCELSSTVMLHYRKRVAGATQPAFTTLDLTANPPEPMSDPVGSRFRMRSVQLDESAGPDLYDIELIGEVTETGGQKGLTVPTRYWVDSIPPTLVSYSPGTGACVGAPQDLYPGTDGIQIDAFGLVAGAENGAEVWLTTYTVAPTPCTPETEATVCTAPQVCRDLVCRSVGTVTAGNFVVREVPVPPGTVTFEYRALDLAGNPSQPGSAQVEVFENAPTVAITAPAVVSPATSVNLGINDDLDKNLPGLQYNVQIAVAYVPAGTLGTLLTGARTYSFIPPTGASGTVNRQVALEDGTHTLSARVQDPCGNSVDSAPVVVNVFSAPPALRLTPYVADNSTCASNNEAACGSASGCMWNPTGTPSCIADFAARRAILDSAIVKEDAVDLDLITGLGVEGHPRDVAVFAYPNFTMSGGNRTCSGTPVTGPTATVPETAQGVLFTDLALIPGVNCFELTVNDDINSLTYNVVVQRKSTVPTPTITAPTAGAITDSDTNPANGFNQTITVTLDAADSVNGVIEVRVQTSSVTRSVLRAAIAAGGTTTTFTNASLPYGDLSLVAAYIDNVGNVSTSAPVAVTADPGAAPAIVITAPANGSALLAPAAPFTFSVANIGAATTGDLTCTLFVGGVASTTTATWTAPAATPVTLSHTFVAAGANDVRVECGTGITQTIRVFVGGTAPELRSEDAGTPGQLVFSPPTGKFVNTLVADTSAINSLQHPVGVIVHTGGGDPTGWLVELTVTPVPTTGVAPAPRTYSTVLTGGGDPVLVTFGSVDFWFDRATNKLGTIAFLPRVTAPGASAVAGTVATLTVDLDPPPLTQVAPPPSQTLLTRVDDADNNRDYVDVGFKYSTNTDPGNAVGNVALIVEPPPHGKTAADFPMTKPAAADVTFDAPRLAFLDGLYTAKASVADLAGNITAVPLYSFEVKGLEARINWGIPGAPGFFNIVSDTNPAQTGIQADFAFNVVGFNPGTVLKLCSTVPTPGAIGTCAAGDELECCRWHPDGDVNNIRTDFTTVDGTAGYVIGTGVLSGSLSGGSVLLSRLPLVDGDQTIHAEAVEPSLNPDGFSSFFAFTVDSVPPEVTQVTFAQNVAGNDVLGTGGYIVLNPTEGTAGSRGLKTRLDFSATGAAPGLSFDVVTNLPVANTVVSLAVTSCTTVAQCQTGQSCVDSAVGTVKECRWLLAGDGTIQTGSVLVDIGEGRQTLAVRIHDEAGNANDLTTDTSAQPTVMVDLTPPTVTLPGPLHGVESYTSADGVISANTLGIKVSLSVADNASLEGATVTLRTFTAASGGSALESMTKTLVSGDTVADFDPFALHMGNNYIEAVLTDAAGNSTQTARSNYTADFLAPTLTLEVWTGGGGATHQTACETNATTGCVADYVDPASQGGLAQLDFTNADSWSLSPATGGTDLRFSLTGINNSTLETPTATVWMESYAVDGPTNWEAVYGSTGLTETTDVALTSYAAEPGMGAYAFYPGTVRAVRLVARDSNLNVSYSPTVYLGINLNGAIVTVERLTVTSASTGDFLEDRTYWGKNERTVGSGFATTLRVTVTVSGVWGRTPTSVDLTVNGVTSVGGYSWGDTGLGNRLLVSGVADFTTVGLVTSKDPGERDSNLNDIMVTVNCSGFPDCGSREYIGVVADVDPPTFQFDRCSLCDLQVPLVTNICPTAACSDAGQWDGEATANIAGASSPATWNAALDQDADRANGLSIRSGKPLRVRLKGIEPGQRVRLVTNQGSLNGNDVGATGCLPADYPACDAIATFDALNVPTLAGAGIHQLTVSTTDRAGNAASVEGGRDPETIFAKTDVLVPGVSQPTACIGESTTPYTISNPVSDPTTYEDPSCAAACAASGACSRRGGKATLVWRVPTEDGASGGPIDHYEIRVAALGIPYPQPFVSGTSTAISQCTSLDVTDATKVEQVITMTPNVAPGGTETKTIVGLYPHRSYCFAVLGVDDSGNAAALAGSVKERSLPLVNFPDTIEFDPLTSNDGGIGGELVTDSDSTVAFGYRIINAGDLDGDGLDDIAVSRFTSGAPRASVGVRVFLSSDPTLTPISIFAPEDGGVSGGRFGVTMAAGDFDGDLLSDLAICARDMPATGGPNPGTGAGALYLYYGVRNQGIRTDANPQPGGSTDLPSIVPDVVIHGPAGARFCNQIAMGHVHSTIGHDIVVSTPSIGTVGGVVNPRVYGFFGGSRARFPTGTIYLDLVSPAGTGFANRPEFSLQRRAATPATFPVALALADVDGDGLSEVAVSDHQATHGTVGVGPGECTGCGEVYVYQGGVGLAGAIAAPDTSPAQLKHTLRFATGSLNFGFGISRVIRPNSPDDTADWLLVHSAAGVGTVVVYKGTSIGGTPGITPATYTPGGEPLASYTLLDRTDWSGTPPSSFGYTFAPTQNFFGSGEADVLVGPAAAGAVNPTMVYRFDRATQQLLKTVVLRGATDFGGSAAAVQRFRATPSGESATQLVVGSPAFDYIALFR